MLVTTMWAIEPYVSIDIAADERFGFPAIL